MEDGIEVRQLLSENRIAQVADLRRLFLKDHARVRGSAIGNSRARNCGGIELENVGFQLPAESVDFSPKCDPKTIGACSYIELLRPPREQEGDASGQQTADDNCHECLEELGLVPHRGYLRRTGTQSLPGCLM